MNPLVWQDVVFLNIETVSAEASYGLLSERMKRHWAWKASTLSTRHEPVDDATLYISRAGVYAEFGRVVCIAIGGVRQTGDGVLSIRVKTLFDRDEKALLESFIKLLGSYPAASKVRLCAHHGREFDFPYLSRRILANRLPLPTLLRYQGKKPWEVNYLDTMDFWKFCDHKNYVPIDLLAAVLGLSAAEPDRAIDPSQLSTFYHQDTEGSIKRISQQCAQSVVTLAQVYLVLQGLNPIDPQYISHV